MKKIVIYANCQGGALIKTLEENPQFLEKFSYIKVPPVQLIKSKEQIDHLVSSIKATDVLIYQHIQGDNFHNDIKTNSLLKHLKPNAIQISFPSLYFDAYFPHLGIMTGLTGPLNLVHDFIIAYCFTKGLSSNDILSIIQNEKLYPKKFSLNTTLATIEAIKQRENNNECDIKITNFIQENFNKEKLFNQFNHPKKSVFKYIASKIFKIIGINIDSFVFSEKGHLDVISTPIYKSTHTNLDLGFDEDFDLYHGLEGPLNQNEVVTKFCSLYKEKGTEFVIHEVNTKKPFVKNLVDSLL